MAQRKMFGKQARRLRTEETKRACVRGVHLRKKVRRKKRCNRV